MACGKITVAFITYKRLSELKKSISSCLEIGGNISEIVVVNNDVEEDIEKALQNFICGKCKFVYWQSDSNLGVAGGRNKAFELASNEYVFFLDDDAVVATPLFFESLMDKMDSHPEIVAASPDIQEPEKNTNLNSPYFFVDAENQYDCLMSYCGCAHVIRKSFFAQFPFLYPENLQFGSEELYSSLLVWMYGKKIARFNDLSVSHYPSVINRCDGFERNFNFILNQYIIKKMVFPLVMLPFSKFFLLLHLWKHHLLDRNFSEKRKKLVKERFDERCVCRMSIAKYVWLLFKFPIKVVV